MIIKFRFCSTFRKNGTKTGTEKSAKKWLSFVFFRLSFALFWLQKVTKHRGVVFIKWLICNILEF